jgi:rSAM/selenodomain-associated transferase 2
MSRNHLRAEASISVIVPTLNEEGNIAASLTSARATAVREIIVVDGGSTDGTLALAGALAGRVISGQRGRASQMNAGATTAEGAILLFLHADTMLPKGFDQAVLGALGDSRVVGGRFDVSLKPSSPLIWLTAALINARSRLTRIATGDQAIFVRRSVFEEMGGFPDIPLMEDIAFSRSLKRRGRVACLRQRVVTSSRRWKKDGVIRTILLMWSLRLLYFLGVSPARLRRVYGDTR